MVANKKALPYLPHGADLDALGYDQLAAWAKMAAAALEEMQSAKNALPAPPPIGVGERSGELDRVFIDAFQRIVLHGEPPRAVLDREAETLNRLLTETGASCWPPDPSSSRACQAR
jgi:multiple sugar transport system substrate-binding protein